MSNPETTLDKYLEHLGWAFMPTGPEEWEWLKFDGALVVARQGDGMWARDIGLWKENQPSEE